MKVWIVMGEIPYESNYVVHICADQLVAQYLRDWCEAVEMDKVFEMNYKYEWSSQVGTYFEIEEDEVIL